MGLSNMCNIAHDAKVTKSSFFFIEKQQLFIKNLHI